MGVPHCSIQAVVELRRHFALFGGRSKPLSLPSWLWKVCPFLDSNIFPGVRWVRFPYQYAMRQAHSLAGQHIHWFAKPASFLNCPPALLHVSVGAGSQHWTRLSTIYKMRNWNIDDSLLWEFTESHRILESFSQKVLSKKVEHSVLAVDLKNHSIPQFIGNIFSDIQYLTASVYIWQHPFVRRCVGPDRRRPPGRGPSPWRTSASRRTFWSSRRTASTRCGGFLTEIKPWYFWCTSYIVYYHDVILRCNRICFCGGAPRCRWSNFVT